GPGPGPGPRPARGDRPGPRGCRAARRGPSGPAARRRAGWPRTAPRPTLRRGRGSGPSAARRISWEDLQRELLQQAADRPLADADRAGRLVRGRPLADEQQGAAVEQRLLGEEEVPLFAADRQRTGGGLAGCG